MLFRGIYKPSNLRKVASWSSSQRVRNQDSSEDDQTGKWKEHLKKQLEPIKVQTFREETRKWE